jgi:hypothetical protein
MVGEERRGLTRDVERGDPREARRYQGIGADGQVGDGEAQVRRGEGRGGLPAVVARPVDAADAGGSADRIGKLGVVER